MNTTLTNTNRLLNDISVAESKCSDIVLDRYALGPWSFSKLKMLKQCPYQFYLKYILKVKRDYMVRDTLISDVGTSAHRILELIMKGRDITTAFKEAEREIVGAKAGGFGKASLTQEQWDERIKTLIGTISDFSRRMDTMHTNLKVKRIHTELKIGITKDYEPTGFFGEDVYFRGIIDLIIQLEVDDPKSSDLLIIDHKHGGGEFNNTTKNYQPQLDTYKVLFHHGIEPVTGAQSGIHFIKEGKVVWGDYKDRATIEKDLRVDLDWRINGAIDTTKERGFFKHVRGNPCQYCEFDEECKAGLLKENELSTKKYFTIKKVD